MSFTIPNTFGSQSGNVPSTQLDDNFIAVKNWADAPDVPTRPPGDATTQAASTAFVSNAIGTSPLGSFRNAIINGDMMIDQRFAGGATTPAASAYTVDRWKANISQASKLTFQRVADAPDGLKYSLKVTVANSFAPGAADFFTTNHPIEGFNAIRFGVGTASPQVITVSFWVKGSVAGTYALSLTNNGVSRSYVGTFPVTGVWTRQTVTLTADNTGSWATDNTIGVNLRFDLGSGTNFNTTPLLWDAGNFTKTAGSTGFVSQANGSTLNITGVQLEIGPSATAFESLPIDVQLDRCQRYFEKSFQYATAPAQNVGVNTGEWRWSAITAGATTQRSPHMPFRVLKRAAGGTVTTYNTSAANANFRDPTAGGDCPIVAAVGHENGIVFQVTGSAGTAIGNSLLGHWTYDCEL